MAQGCFQPAQRSDQGLAVSSEAVSPEQASFATLNDKLPRMIFNAAQDEDGEETAYRRAFNLFTLKDYKLTLKGELPKVPEYLWVYKVDYKGFTLEEAKKIAQETFGMNPERFWLRESNNSTVYFEDSDYRLWVYMKHEGAGGEGRFTYALKSEVCQKLEDKGISVSQEEARQIADKFLKSHGLYPEGQIKGAVIGEGTNTTFPADNGKPITWTTSYTVYYIASVDEGYSAIGNTLDLRVGIMADGVISEVSKRWMNFKKYKKYPTKTILEAFQDAYEYPGYSSWLPRQLIGGEMFFSRVSYDAEDFRFEYLQPCYDFRIEKADPEGKLECGVTVSAIKDSYYLEPLKPNSKEGK